MCDDDGALHPHPSHPSISTPPSIDDDLKAYKLAQLEETHAEPDDNEDARNHELMLNDLAFDTDDFTRSDEECHDAGTLSNAQLSGPTLSTFILYFKPVYPGAFTDPIEVIQLFLHIRQRPSIDDTLDENSLW